ncbi:MAG: DUF5674 family protein [Planctomycetota bacterium]|nr:DUF5674 family protein [Planctomycetota bacterium]
MDIMVLRQAVARAEMTRLAEQGFGDLVKAVVDVRLGIIAVGGELHADEEAILLEQGSRQEDLWGINIYPSAPPDRLLEFDSIINLRPSRGNRSRSVDDPGIRDKIRQVVESLVKP